MLRNVTQAQMTYFQGQENFDKVDFTKYYGYTVGHETTEVSGGYCGVMTTGVMEDCVAYDLISAEGIQQAGGFAGTVKGGQIWGEADSADFAEPSSQLVQTYSQPSQHCFTKNLRSVTASGVLSDAGGFAGYMGAESVAALGGLGLLGKLVELPTNFISLISATVPTVYYADVSAVDSWGFSVNGNGGRSAGGFAGLLQAGVVRFCTAEELALVSGKNYAGGFVARMGKSSILKADDVATTSELGILGDLLTLSLSVSDVFGSHIEDSSLTGTEGATPCWPGGATTRLPAAL